VDYWFDDLAACFNVLVNQKREAASCEREFDSAYKLVDNNLFSN
jgi:hypothetical protein